VDTFVGFLLLVQLSFASVTVLGHLIPFCLCYDSVPYSQAQEKAFSARGLHPEIWSNANASFSLPGSRWACAFRRLRA